MVQQIKKFLVRKNKFQNYLYLNILLVYFESLDINKDRFITREDLEQCLPPTVESQELIQQLLRQWDMVNIFK